MPPENQFQNQNQEMNPPHKKSPLIWAIVLIVILGVTAFYFWKTSNNSEHEKILFDEIMYSYSGWPDISHRFIICRDGRAGLSDSSFSEGKYLEGKLTLSELNALRETFFNNKFFNLQENYQPSQPLPDAGPAVVTYKDNTGIKRVSVRTQGNPPLNFQKIVEELKMLETKIMGRTGQGTLSVEEIGIIKVWPFSSELNLAKITSAGSRTVPADEIPSDVRQYLSANTDNPYFIENEEIYTAVLIEHNGYFISFTKPTYLREWPSDVNIFKYLNKKDIEIEREDLQKVLPYLGASLHKMGLGVKVFQSPVLGGNSIYQVSIKIRGLEGRLPENFCDEDIENALNINDSQAEIKNERSKESESKETALDTSDWQTYRNEEFGFEVKYPDDFRVFDRQLNKSNVVNLPGSIGIVEFCPLSLGIRCDHPSGRPGIHLGISNQPTDIIFTNSEQSIRSIRYRDYIVNNIKHLDLNGITGFIIDADNNQGSRFINFVVVSENYIFTMFGWGNTEEERIDFGTKIFEVAPTFQFIQ